MVFPLNDGNQKKSIMKQVSDIHNWEIFLSSSIIENCRMLNQFFCQKGFWLSSMSTYKLKVSIVRKLPEVVRKSERLAYLFESRDVKLAFRI